ncbi:nucleocapsid [Raspberry vein chlorosis virus]|uniref:Nucleoprotein n=1 Tax=Raspberry vein chlorosis virus TaxID=758677 RepID=A0A482PG11_9RHAB|nr:nucleocapsid [Raspberry vein chlorosis virus]QBS46629.1 nucleocapsid [Raspberry vein chlorosis virus]
MAINRAEIKKALLGLRGETLSTEQRRAPVPNPNNRRISEGETSNSQDRKQKGKADDVKTNVNRPPKVQKYQDIDGISLSIGREASKWEDAHFKSLQIFDISPLDVDDGVLFGRAVIKAINEGTITSDILFMMLYLAVSCRSTMDIKKYLLSKPSGMAAMMDHTPPATNASDDHVEDATQDRTEDVISGVFSNSAGAGGKVRRNRAGKNSMRPESSAAISRAQAARSNTVSAPAEDSDKDHMAAAYSYISAFLMRLQCRQPDSKMITALEKARARYNGFYDEGQSVFDSLNVSEESMAMIREVLARKPEITSTWVAWTAYNENETNLGRQDKGLLDYLATQVFAYQGMHMVTQTLTIHQITKVPLGKLLAQMDCQMTRSAVNEIYYIVRDYHKNELHPERKTYYRYARVWSDGYFSKVQSKACGQLLYLAAITVKNLGASTNSDPTEIYAIKDLSAAARERLDKVSAKLIDYIWSLANNDEEAGDIWKS